jgi:hypothetical protein
MRAAVRSPVMGTDDSMPDAVSVGLEPIKAIAVMKVVMVVIFIGCSSRVLYRDR